LRSTAAECCQGFWGVPQLPDLSPKIEGRGLTQLNVMMMMMQQDAARVWGVPRNSFSPPKIGGKGVEGSHSRIFLRCVTQNSVSSVENKHDD
jgi:hypothetical protein